MRVEREKLSILQRTMAAAIGGYALAALGSICLSFVITGPRADAVLSGLIVSFAIYAAAIIWAFAVRSIARMWLGIGVLTVAFGVFAGALTLFGVS